MTAAEHTSPPESRIAICNAVRIEYLVEGTGPAMVILPSLGRGAGDYDVLSRILASNGLRIIRPQPRGVGRSAGPMTGLTMQDLARDVACVLDHEELSNVLVAGHAFGNFIARMLAVVRPDLTAGIALVAASAGKGPNGKEPYDDDVIQSIYASSDLSLPEEERIEHLRRAFFAPGNDARAWLGGWHPETKIAQRAAQAATPLDEYYGGGCAPIFHLHAADDTVAPQAFQAVLADALGDRVHSEVIENAGHALIPEQPQAVAAALSRWAKSFR